MPKKIDKITYLLILIIILASFLRLIHLGDLPSGLNNDEALAGYDAYSLLKTGKDHRGNPWPLYFEGFSDRVSNHFSLYVYSAIPSIAIFDLNEFSTRLPAAIFGILTVLITYFLGKEIFNNKIIGLLSAFLLAISPWHVQISRFGQEAIMVPLFLGLGISLFLKGIKGNKLLLILSSLPLALSLYGYSIVKLLTPLVVLGLFVIYRKDLWRYKRHFLLFLILFLIIAGPFIYLHLAHFDKLQGRLSQVAITNQDFWLLVFLKEYLSYITPAFFWQVDFFHFYEAILIVIGLVISFMRIRNRDYQFLVFLFLIFPLPAALTDFPLHFLRSIFGFSILPLLSGLAIYHIYLFLKRFKVIYQRIFIYFFTILVLISLVNITLLISNKYPKPFGGFAYRYYNYKEVVDYIRDYGANYEKIFFTNNANQPHIFLLFYLKYDPHKFQSEPVVRYYTLDNWQRVYSFNKFIFCDIDQCYNENDNNLYIARQNDVPEVKPIKIIYGPGDPIYGLHDYISFKIIDNRDNNEE